MVKAGFFLLGPSDPTVVNGPAAPCSTVDTQEILTYNIHMMRTLALLAVLYTLQGCGHVQLVNNRDGSMHAYTVGRHRGSELYIGE